MNESREPTLRELLERFEELCRESSVWNEAGMMMPDPESTELAELRAELEFAMDDLEAFRESEAAKHG